MKAMDEPRGTGGKRAKHGGAGKAKEGPPPQQQQHPAVLPAPAEPSVPRDLSLDIINGVLHHLPPNEVACTARLLCKDTKNHFSAPQHRTVRLSQPIPPHAVSWRCGEEALRQLTFKGKLGALSTAAVSGCQTNLEVAWRLLEPSFFPDTCEDVCYMQSDHEGDAPYPDPGTAAARAGHAHLLPWMVEHHCPLDAASTLAAVAEHCDLAALQQAWALLRRYRGASDAALVPAAARSRTPDALRKLQWLVVDQRLGVKGEFWAGKPMACAAEAGTRDALLWLKSHGCDLSEGEGAPPRGCGHSHKPPALAAALEHGSMDFVLWLWRERGLSSLAAHCHRDVVEAAAASGVEGVAKLAWLQEVGVVWYHPHETVGQHPPLDRAPPGPAAALGLEALRSAAAAGRLGTVRYLVEQAGVDVPRGSDWLTHAVAGSGDRGVMQYLTQRGVAKSHEAYVSAADKGDLELVRWLLAEGYGIDQWTAVNLIRGWPLRGTPGCSSRVEEDCLAAVQAVCAAGGFVRDLVGPAVQRGSLPLLRWLYDECDFVLPPYTMARAAEGGCAEVLERLVAQGCPFDDKPGREYAGPAQRGDRATLALLRQLGVPWGGRGLQGGLTRVCEGPVIEWFVQQRMQLAWGTVHRSMNEGKVGGSTSWMMDIDEELLDRD